MRMGPLETREFPDGLRVSVRHSVEGKELTSIRIGGPLECLVLPKTTEELARLLAAGVGFEAVLGAGTNALVADEGIRGFTLGLKMLNREIAWSEEPDGRMRVSAGAGVPLRTLARQTAERGLGGLEWAVGIPGTVGGAVVMNAGAHGGDLSQVAGAVTLCLAGGEVVDFTGEGLRFTYRRFQRPAGSVVVGADLVLTPDDPEAVRARCEEYRAQRRRREPSALPSAGSVFRNPPGAAAGALIEQTGLKGRRVGGARISERHANYIVNEGGATARDVWELMAECRRQVAHHFGIWLEPEVALVGEWPAGCLEALGLAPH